MLSGIWLSFIFQMNRKIMIRKSTQKKNKKPSKPKLKGKAPELLDKLEILLKEGKELSEREIIDGDEYDNWYNKVLSSLKDGFIKSDNKYVTQFEGPASYIQIRQDGVSSVQVDEQFSLRSYLGDNLTDLDVIINDISTLY